MRRRSLPPDRCCVAFGPTSARTVTRGRTVPCFFALLREDPRPTFTFTAARGAAVDRRWRWPPRSTLISALAAARGVCFFDVADVAGDRCLVATFTVFSSPSNGPFWASAWAMPAPRLSAPRVQAAPPSTLTNHAFMCVFSLVEGSLLDRVVAPPHARGVGGRPTRDRSDAPRCGGRVEVRENLSRERNRADEPGGTAPGTGVRGRAASERRRRRHRPTWPAREEEG